jgi:hypothetical protein
MLSLSVREPADKTGEAIAILLSRGNARDTRDRESDRRLRAVARISVHESRRHFCEDMVKIEVMSMIDTGVNPISGGPLRPRLAHPVVDHLE